MGRESIFQELAQRIKVEKLMNYKPKHKEFENPEIEISDEPRNRDFSPGAGANRRRRSSRPSMSEASSSITSESNSKFISYSMSD